MQKVKINRDKALEALQGHPWVFTHALLGKIKLKSGELCEIYLKEKFVGIGYIDNRTNIAIRILTRKKESIDASFFKKLFLKLKK